VQQELEKEFPWVQVVRNFITNLESPYTVSGGASFAVDDIYDQIKASVPPPSGTHSALYWLGVADSALDIAVKVGVPESLPAFEAVSVTDTGIKLADDLILNADGSSATTVSAPTPDELADDLYEQQLATVEGIQKMELILLTDYGRLSAVGSAAGGSDASWAWTPDSTIDAITALNAATRAASYTTLIPETWVSTSLEPEYYLDPGSEYPGNNWQTDSVAYYQCTHGAVFKNAKPGNIFEAVSRIDSDQPPNYGQPNLSTGTPLSDVWTFADDVSSGEPTLPGTSLTDDIYGLDSTGSSGAFQYAPDWWRTTYNPPGGVICRYQDGFAESGESWHAPISNIPPPLP
jgi:hypothetical protein